jgi:membrane fusion protein (multidrug efflux system)
LVLAAFCPLATLLAPAAGWMLMSGTALGAPPPAPPSTVGVMAVHRRAVTSSANYIGRIQAIDRVALVPRVTAYLEKRLFDEGAEVKKGDLLYVLEQGPFQAQVLAQQGTLAQAQANVINARVNFQRQAALLKTPAGQQQAYDNAQATAQSGAASVLTAQGNLQSAQIQLAYTEIRAPVDGRITSTAVNQGNVVSPTSGTLATIVTQDPMYVVFPAATRDVLTLQKKYEASGGLGQAAIRMTLGDGTRYDHDGHLDYVSPSVSNETDTITLRATVPNPTRGQNGATGLTSRELVDGEFVTVTVQDPHPVEHLVIPRSAVLSDQQGDYVFTVAAQNTAKRTNVKLGETVGTDAVVLSGLSEGQQVIVDGIQTVHDGAKVQPAAPQPVVADPDPAEGDGDGGGQKGSAKATSTGGVENSSTPGGLGMQPGGAQNAVPGSQGAKDQAAATHGNATPAAGASPSQR